jgi:hypothetical protein
MKVFKIFTSICFILIGVSAHPQDKVDISLLLTAGAVRGLDVYSTHQMLVKGNQELILPQAVAKSTPAMVGVQAGVVVADWLVGRALRKHHHPKLARTITLIDIGADAPWAIHNLYLPDHRRHP